MTKILIADDQRLLRESFKYIIENNSDMKVIGSVENGKEAYEFCSKFIPDLILMDLSMPVCPGTEATKLIKAKYPSVKILILTSSDDSDDVAEAIGNGADGYIIKDIGTGELILSIKSIVAGLGIIHKNMLNKVSQIYNNSEKDVHGVETDVTNNTTIQINGFDTNLSEKDIKIIQLIVDGNDNKQIGELLFMAEGTIKNKITEIIQKLQVKDRTQLAVFAMRHHLV